MRIKVGEVYKNGMGEKFGPMQASGDRYALPFYCVKFGQVFTFHDSGRYSLIPRFRHILDLVAPSY